MYRNTSFNCSNTAVFKMSFSISVILTLSTSFDGGALYCLKCSNTTSNSQLFASDSKYSACIISAICCKNILSVNNAAITFT